MQHEFVSLNLSAPTDAVPTTVHARLLDAALALIRDMLAAEHEPARTALAERFEQCRAAMAAGQPVPELAAMTEACLADGRHIVADHQALRVARAREMSALVAALREVVVSIGSEMTTLSSGLERSTGRFDAISTLDDPVQIKQQLLEEIAALKQLTLQRRQAWEATSQRLNERIASLEHQLVATQTEASTDPLTQISNRRVFERTCEDWIQTPRASFALALMDVDDLKPINDTHGHEAGDQVLYFVAQTLARSLRPGDVVSRIGGDEFAVLAPNLTLAEAEKRFRAILAALNHPDHAILERPEHMPGVSCGVAEFSAGDTSKTLLKRADDALYDAKRQGKNRLAARPVPFIRDYMGKRQPS